MQSYYNLWLVAISFVVATLASYAALDLTGRIFLLAAARVAVFESHSVRSPDAAVSQAATGRSSTALTTSSP